MHSRAAASEGARDGGGSRILNYLISREKFIRATTPRTISCANASHHDNSHNQGRQVYVFRDGRLVEKTDNESKDQTSTRRSAVALSREEAMKRNAEHMKRFHFGHEPPPRSRKVTSKSNFYYFIINTESLVWAFVQSFPVHSVLVSVLFRSFLFEIGINTVL